MSLARAIDLFNLFFAGLFAGQELIMRFGVRGPLTTLDQRPQILMRQALILRLRIIVPVLFVATALTGIGITVLAGLGPGFVFRCLALLAVLVWALATFIGTVPINSAALEWDPDAPPADWAAVVGRWERLTSARALAVTAAFAFFLIGAGLQSG